jgi:hypothetical protein
MIILNIIKVHNLYCRIIIESDSLQFFKIMYIKSNINNIISVNRMNILIL